MPSPEDIEKAIGSLLKKKLLIGIPAEKDPRPGEAIGNASLGY